MKLCKCVLLTGGIVLLLGGCSSLVPSSWENDSILEPLSVFPVFSNSYLLSCISEMEALNEEKFARRFEYAASHLADGGNLDKLRFICLSLTSKAEYGQFRKGWEVFHEYLDKNPGQREDMQGFRILLDRLKEEIQDKRSIRKAFLAEENELLAEIESLKIRLEEQQKQVERLKNIEPIIKSREDSNE